MRFVNSLYTLNKMRQGTHDRVLYEHMKTCQILFFALVTALTHIQVSAASGVTTYHNDTEGYLAMPDGATDAPALILIHEWWGLNDDIRNKAEGFAAAGYVVLAVDLYSGEHTTIPKRARQLARAVAKNPKAAFANLRSAANYLRNLPETSPDRLGSVGWCFGGGWSYQIAKNNLGAKASVIYYGRFNPQDDLSKMRTNIIGHFGKKDLAIKVSTVREFQAKLKTHGGSHEIFIYPNAGHGFANPDNPAYRMKAAQKAQRRTLNFLARHL